MMKNKVIPIELLLFTFLLLNLAAAEEMKATAADAKAKAIAKNQHERIFIVNEYQYQPPKSGSFSDIGQALCGTRCNALSVDYQNYLKPPGWRIIRIANNKRVIVDINNPFIDGNCICVADEYIVKVNELYMVK